MAEPGTEALEALRRRDRLLEAVGYAARSFLGSTEWRREIDEVLARLGRATGVSRIYVFENRRDSEGVLRTSHRYEWTAEGIASQLGNPELDDVPYADSGFERWRRILETGEPLVGAVDDFPPAERELLRAQGILSLLVVPIRVEEEFWGFMGFDECSEPREWSGPEIEVLRTAADTLAAAIHRRRTEQALRESEEQLRQAQRMEAIGRLSAGIAHDFNNLLTAIQANAEFLLQDLEDGHPSRQEAAEIRSVTERAADLTSQLLAFGRKQVLRPRPMSLNDVVERMELLLERVLPESIRLTTELEPELPPVHADPTQVEQVVMNLAVNARDAMETGGHLRLRTRSLDFDGEYARLRGCPEGGEYAILSVADTGKGMDPETVERAFEPFFTTKEASKGTGLGLSTVYGIAKQSGGTAWIYTEPRRGTTVKVALPRHHEEGGSADEESGDAGAAGQTSNGELGEAAPAGVESSAGPGEAARTAAGAAPAEDDGPLRSATDATVLVVEDDEAVRRVAVRVLRNRGFEVRGAASAAEGLDAFRKLGGAVDVLLSDVALPDRSGGALAQEVLEEDPDVRVLFMSGMPDGERPEAHVDGTKAALIEKPFSAEALARRIRALLATDGDGTEP